MNARLQKTLGILVIAETTLLLLLAWMLFPQWAERTSNIGPGDADYPVKNLRAHRSVAMTLLVPSSLHPKFSAIYSATLGRDTVPKPRQCHFALRTGTATEYSMSLHEYSVAVPLELVFQGDEEDRFPHSRGLKRYRVEVMVDRFEPSRCQWNLDRVVYSAGNKGESSELFGFKDDDRRRSGYVPSLDVWCTTRPATREMSAHEACSGPRHYPEDRAGYPDATDIALFPDKDLVHFVLGPEDTAVIEFHDVDHPVPASMVFPYGSSGPSAKHR